MDSDKIDDKCLEPLEGPAFSCIIATFCALAISNAPNNVPLAILYWLSFSIISGLFIDPLKYASIRQLVSYCLAPALWLVLVWFGIAFIQCIWTGKWTWGLLVTMLELSPLVLVATCVSITIGALARRKLIMVFKTDSGEIDRVSKSLGAIGALLTMALAGAISLLHLRGAG